MQILPTKHHQKLGKIQNVILMWFQNAKAVPNLQNNLISVFLDFTPTFSKLSFQIIPASFLKNGSTYEAVIWNGTSSTHEFWGNIAFFLNLIT